MDGDGGAENVTRAVPDFIDRHEIAAYALRNPSVGNGLELEQKPDAEPRVGFDRLPIPVDQPDANGSLAGCKPDHRREE